MSELLMQKAPDFTAQSTQGTITLSELKNSYVVLYFYPKDNTSGCTMEGRDFSALYSQFQAQGCQVIGVSRDSLKSHQNFCAKQGFPFPLVSDGDETLCRLYDVMKLKKMYGREYMGIERSTFLINPEGVVIGEWRKVKVPDHAKMVLQTLIDNINQP
ncbi:MAG TPA: peroxiredoxin [Candidatus Aphodousia faecipullorum]|nr:peroxiredoxin [Candidatus Aphodousia faecipullorum]